MLFRVNPARLALAFVLVTWIIIATVETTNIKVIDAINYINKERKIEINVLVNVAKNYESRDSFEMVKATEVPKLLLSNTTNLDKIMPVYERFNKNVLTIAWLTKSNFNASLQLLDSLLWRIHFKDILLVFQQELENDAKELNKNILFPIFQECWSKGFISVLVWTDYKLYTYHPYPIIKVVAVPDISIFMDKSHLNNLQQYACRMPFVDYPNLCYNYTNRQGKLIRTGYFYKWVQFYLEYYNASIDHYFLNMWRQDFKPIEAINYLNKVGGYCLMPLFMMTREPDYFESSDVLYLTRVVLLVPSAKEIEVKLYLTLPIKDFIWLICIASGGMFFILIFFKQRNAKVVRDIGKLALQAFSVIIFISSGFSGKKSLQLFYFHLLFLFTGIFLTNHYTSHLSSLYASKVYELELKYLNDIGKTNLKIFEHSYDEQFVLTSSLPRVLDGRFIRSSNADLAKYRLSLNMSYIYKTHDEAADFILFQQYYLKHPIARKLNQPMFTRPHYVTLPHRSPLINHFNRYLSRMRDNGLLMKFIEDTKLDGIWSGRLKFMRDSYKSKSLTLQYFHYAFVLLAFGLLCASLSFLVELKCIKRKRKVMHNCS